MEKKRSVIEEYILENKDKFYRLAFAYTKNREDALDIVQDSIVKALRSYDSLQNIKHIKTWYYKILTNSAIDFIRKNKKYVLTDEDTMAVGRGKCDIYENLDLKKALNLLSYEYRMVIMLRYFEDLKLQEIADVLGENINTVKTRLYKALKLLKLDDSIKEEY